MNTGDLIEALDLPADARVEPAGTQGAAARAGADRRRQTPEQGMRSVVFSYAQKASQDFADLFDGEAVFQNPKSYRDLKRPVAYLKEPGDLVVDFFAGSRTTGHGTMLANTEAEPPRRFNLVQLPEPRDLNDNDQKIVSAFCDKVGRPRKLAELTIERLHRAAKNSKEETVQFPGDLGCDPAPARDREGEEPVVESRP